jgi:hypothetical protein
MVVEAHTEEERVHGVNLDGEGGAESRCTRRRSGQRGINIMVDVVKDRAHGCVARK